MKKFNLILLVLFAAFNLRAQSADKKACITCNQLKNIKLPDVTIVSVESMAVDTITGAEAWMGRSIINVPFCKLYGRISKEINFELLLPLQWNGRFLMSGGGGFVGNIQNDLRNYVNQGYATAGTDTGHKGSGTSAEWALNNMEQQLNFGRLAIHRTAVVAKSIINSTYCADAAYCYFLGCSRGGGQALVEAQHYPDDFDGLVAGAPAFSWPATGGKFIKACQDLYDDSGRAIVTNENLKLVQDFVLKNCDNLDGVADKIINDPRVCKMDWSKIPLCPDGKGQAGCLTKEQLSFFQNIYNPLVVDSKVVYPGFPVGLEAEPGSWNVWITGTAMPGGLGLHYLFGTNMYKYLVFNDPFWDYRKYDFKNYFNDTRYAASFLDATQSDYSAFKSANKKMILYHGWNDPALSAYSTIEHYEEAMKKDKDVSSYIRLFLMPGVLHCGGGTGPDNVDWVNQIRMWVEEKKAPGRIVMSKIENGKIVMTRPVFPYPALPAYNGKGDTNQEQSFKATGN